MGVRDRAVAEALEEAARLSGVVTAEITPSRRDFTLFVRTQKRGIAVVPRFRRQDPLTGGAGSGCDCAAVARRWDGADAPAIAVSTSRCFGGSRDDLRAVALAVSAAVLCDSPCLTAGQIYLARLHGADAVVLPASHLEAADLRALTALAGTMHMATVIEVSTESELRAAVEVAGSCVGLYAAGSDERMNVEVVRSLAQRIPPRSTVLILNEIASVREVASLEGLVDAVVCGAPALSARDDDLATLFAAGR